MQQKCSVMQFEKRGSQFFLLRPSPPMQILILSSSAPYDEKFASCDPKEMTKSIFRDLVPLRPRHFLSIAATSSQHFLQQNGELA